MRKYKYKNSSIEWLGEIPEHWQVDRIKDRTTGVAGGDWGNDPDSDSEGENIVVLRVADLNEMYFKFEDLTIRKIKDSSFKSRRILPNSLIIEKSGGGEKQLVGRVGYPKGIDFDAICSNFMAKIDFGKTVDLIFMNYYFACLYSNRLNFPFVQQTTGIQNLNVTYYLNTHIAIPPIKEQKIIAEYLEKTCLRIDKIIDLKKRQLNQLEEFFTNRITTLLTHGVGNSTLEDTSCLWMPKIKSGWKIKPLKRLLIEKLKYGANESAENENHDEPRYIRITDFDKSGKLKDDTFKSLPNDIAEPYLLSEGDVLFARSGATVGKTFIFKNYSGKACFAGYLIKANCDRAKLLPEFLYYYTKSKCYEEWKNLIFTQATIQNIGADKYQYLVLPVPSIKEQKEIVSTIDNVLHKVDAIKEKVEQQITTLVEYKKSIIHECVTGKKQVADIAVEKVIKRAMA